MNGAPSGAFSGRQKVTGLAPVAADDQAARAIRTRSRWSSRVLRNATCPRGRRKEAFFLANRIAPRSNERKELRGESSVAWFKPREIKVPILPDNFGEDDLDLKTSRPSPKDTFDKEPFDSVTTFDSVAIREDRPSPPKRAAFTVHASRNGEINEVQQDSPTLTVAKARGLFKTGWKVHIADSAGRRYAPSEFDEILRFDR